MLARSQWCRCFPAAQNNFLIQLRLHQSSLFTFIRSCTCLRRMLEREWQVCVCVCVCSVSAGLARGHSMRARVCVCVCVFLFLQWAEVSHVNRCVSALYLVIFCWESLQCHCKVMTDLPSAADPPPDRHDVCVCVCVCVCVTVRTSRWRQALGLLCSIYSIAGIGSFSPEGQCTAEFNQTHLEKRINVFKITGKLQTGVFD